LALVKKVSRRKGETPISHYRKNGYTRQMTIKPQKNPPP
jgi:hypothetical protein